MVCNDRHHVCIHAWVISAATFIHFKVGQFSYYGYRIIFDYGIQYVAFSDMKNKIKYSRPLKKHSKLYNACSLILLFFFQWYENLNLSYIFALRACLGFSFKTFCNWFSEQN